MEETKLPTDLEEFLENKPLYYDKIDYERMPNTYKRIQHLLPKPKIIHLVGTNAKGTTGRFLAQSLYDAGYNVGHYTSPHILRFNERIWINAQDIDDSSLQKAHQKLQKILTQEESDALSYFEYTTLLAMVAFESCEYVVMEAGLGGEKDATAVFDSILTIITPIDFDHQNFLGTTIEQIATTKINAAKNAILVAKQPHQEVIEVAKKIAEEKKIPLYFVQQKKLPKNNLAPYLQENLQTALNALDILKIAPKKIPTLQLFGRLSKIAPNIIIDVGHNPLAAKAITKALQPKKYTLIYNTFSDKNYKKIIKILTPIIDSVEILTIYNQRGVDIDDLQRTLTNLKIEYSIFERIDPKKQYLVFGSFSVIEEFLKQIDD